jgi:hypothetical protein|tara:strand:+ start:7440 stop:8096 length:657 start_codon:yes stop_codon:yes gene_type:complete
MGSAYDDMSTVPSYSRDGTLRDVDYTDTSGSAYGNLSRSQQRKMDRAAKLDSKGKAVKAEELRNKALYGTKDPAEIAKMKLLEEARLFDQTGGASAGVTRQEREETMMGARQAAEQSAQGIQTMLARKEMSGAGIQSPGALQEAARDAGSGGAAIIADASARLAKLDVDRRKARKAELMAALAGAPVAPPSTAQQMATTFATDVAPQILGDIAYGAVV